MRMPYLEILMPGGITALLTIIQVSVSLTIAVQISRLVISGIHITVVVQQPMTMHFMLRLLLPHFPQIHTKILPLVKQLVSLVHTEIIPKLTKLSMEILQTMVTVWLTLTGKEVFIGMLGWVPRQQSTKLSFLIVPNVAVIDWAMYTLKF